MPPGSEYEALPLTEISGPNDNYSNPYQGRQPINQWPLLAAGLLGFCIALVPSIFYANLPTSKPLDLAPFRFYFHSEPTQNDKPADFNCPIPLIYTTDQRSADAVLWSSDFFDAGHRAMNRTLLRQEYPWQYQVVTGAEAAPQRKDLERHYDLVKQGLRNMTFDAEMTYRLDSAVPQTYAYDFFNFSKAPLPWETKRKDRIAAVFMSNCHGKNYRNLILQQLMAYLPEQIDSFGSCLKNANADQVLQDLNAYDTIEDKSRWNIKLATIARYKFSIAFENSNEIDYVTEKFYQAMEAGSVPIYLGTPSFNTTFLPTVNSAIDLGHYIPPEYVALSRNNDTYGYDDDLRLSDEAKQGLYRLAEKLKELSSEKGRYKYEAMLAWKLNDKWKRSPFGIIDHIGKLGRDYYSDHCRLAGVLRGQRWAFTNFTRPT